MDSPPAYEYIYSYPEKPYCRRGRQYIENNPQIYGPFGIMKPYYKYRWKCCESQMVTHPTHHLMSDELREKLNKELIKMHNDLLSKLAT